MSCETASAASLGLVDHRHPTDTCQPMAGGGGQGNQGP